MKLLRLPLILAWACLTVKPGAPPTPLATPPPDAGISQDGQSRGRGANPQPDPSIDVAKIQRDGMIKADHKKNLEDAAALLKLAEELKSDLDKQDALIVSARNIKQAEEIQKLAKGILGRLKRY